MKKEYTQTVRELLERYWSFGRHSYTRPFWRSDSVSLLLESLYNGTPCGTIILWKPLDPDEVGFPLPGVRRQDVAYLVIDGQQRIQGIHYALGQALSESEDAAERGPTKNSEDRRYIWCLNLTRVPELQPLFEDSPLIKQPLFVNFADPRMQIDKPCDLIPLSVLLGPLRRPRS